MELAGVPADDGTSIEYSWGNLRWRRKHLPVWLWYLRLKSKGLEDGLKWNRSKRRKSEILDQVVDVPNLEIQEDLERFITVHKELLRWWLGRYIPSYVKDITDNAVVHPIAPEKWRTTWQQAVLSCGTEMGWSGACSVICQFFFWHSHIVGPGEDLEIKDFDITWLEEQPALTCWGRKSRQNSPAGRHRITRRW